jgi:hypothetical protein
MAYLFFFLCTKIGLLSLNMPCCKLKRKETIAKWKISLFDKRWDWSISVDSLK